MRAETGHLAAGDTLLLWLAAVFVGSLVMAAVLASKIIVVAGLTVPAGVLAYCVTFVCTDVISELWGKEQAKRVILSGFGAMIFALLLIKVAVAWPAAPFWTGQSAFESVFDLTPRIILGSLSAYLVSQTLDVWAFHAWKSLTRGKHLWLRNNASTVVSQLVDSSLFILIAFGGHLEVMPLILGQWVIKCAIAALDTGVVYGLVWFIKRRQPGYALSS